VAGAPWFAEGLATYLEPIIRARLGLQTTEAMWTEFMTYMPRGAGVIEASGLARGGRRGWYWGGAVLMLLADVEMRRASEGRAGLEDCLRRIRTELGDFREVLAVDTMVAACDAALGGRVLGDAVARYGYAAGSVDLEGLWRALGLELVDGRATFDDRAPLAGVRRSIERGSGW
jgi:predicted metalloprotease with PDZ domain